LSKPETGVGLSRQRYQITVIVISYAFTGRSDITASGAVYTEGIGYENAKTKAAATIDVIFSGITEVNYPGPENILKLGGISGWKALTDQGGGAGNMRGRSGSAGEGGTVGYADDIIRGDKVRFCSVI
jgi:hypothetical protein